MTSRRLVSLHDFHPDLAAKPTPAVAAVLCHCGHPSASVKLTLSFEMSRCQYHFVHCFTLLGHHMPT